MFIQCLLRNEVTFHCLYHIVLWCTPCDSRPRMRARAKHDWGRRTTETVVLLNRARKTDLGESGG